MREVLRRQGYQVLTADSEAQALWVWERQAQRIDLLITDVMIPNCTTGIQLAKRLRQQKPTLRVICVSGFSRDIGSGETSFVTRFPFLQKPCSPRLLLETVHRCLSGSVESPQAWA
jgi:two-component system cell cycle sensor histidine kinase/response regulator CckA